MLRGLFASAAAVSLLVCLASLVLWVRSYWITDTVTYQRVWASTLMHVDDYVVRSSRGRLIFWRGRFAAPKLKPATGVLEAHVYWWTKRGRYRASYSPDLRIPLAGIFIISAVLPYLYLRRYRLKRLIASIGRCPKCGYDLRASPERCPE